MAQLWAMTMDFVGGVRRGSCGVRGTAEWHSGASVRYDGDTRGSVTVRAKCSRWTGWGGGGVGGAQERGGRAGPRRHA